ncbi:hypothetical protein LCGC14_1147950 [marine sediment metagenome]|uniref:DUF551 domain-containing protein n=1 Tax=marine sediment metagenome TaxID=412755 RepID=A0A0F9Q1Z7_9ZZZZ
MGIYINPSEQTKEQWLEEYAVETLTPKYPPTEGLTLICLVENNLFTAAGVIFDRNEWEAFNEPHDLRLRRWFTAPVSEVDEVAD